MDLTDLEANCEHGQRLLMEMRYREAEAVLAQVEVLAWEGQNWDLLSRLYLPLQEARRQRRQRSGEGIVRLDFLARNSGEELDVGKIVGEIPQGQILIGAWGSINPALTTRELAAKQGLYLDVFLAASFPSDSVLLVAIVPHERVSLPSPQPNAIRLWASSVCPEALLLTERDLPIGSALGSAATFAVTMKLWERLHAPFLARAERENDPVRKMAMFRETIAVDYGCELAHQHLADVARMLSRGGRRIA